LPIPAYQYKVSPGNQLYDMVMATESDELKLTLNTKGEIEVSGDGDQLALVNYTPKTLGNALALAGDIMGNDSAEFEKTYSKPIQNLVSILYNLVRLRLTVLITPV